MHGLGRGDDRLLEKQLFHKLNRAKDGKQEQKKNSDPNRDEEEMKAIKRLPLEKPTESTTAAAALLAIAKHRENWSLYQNRLVLKYRVECRFQEKIKNVLSIRKHFFFSNIFNWKYFQRNLKVFLSHQH